MIRRALILLSLVAFIGWMTPHVSAQDKNSTRKIRIQPGEISGKCGSAVQWRDSVEKAMEESAKLDKPVFWYVPTIQSSFMDRKPVIDQYMMAGPFAWPAIVDLLNEHFIPVRAVATNRLQQKFENIKRYEFVEPGFVIVNPDGTVKKTVDQLTTLDPYWIISLFAGLADVETPPLWSDPAMQAAALAFRKGQTPEFHGSESKDETTIFLERILLAGMMEYRSGDHAKARAVWKAAENYPDHPLAWKALAEAENWGPFVRGFETHTVLPDAAYRAGLDSRGSAAPKGIYSEAELWTRSTDYLLAMQSQEGAWVDSDYDFGGTDSLPNVHVAVTALCGSALLEALSHHKAKSAEITAAIQKAAEFCADRNNINYVDRDEILWAHAYRARFFAKLVSQSDEFKAKYQSTLSESVADLESIQTARGTWYHEYANSFVTATALTALKCAADAGAKVDDNKIQRGVASLANDRFDNGAYPYLAARGTRERGTAESSGRGKIPASAGRMPLCELGLWQWGGSDDQRLQFALNASFENHKHLAVSYKYDNHTDTMAYGGFFFWYDMRSRAEALNFMSDNKLRSEYASQHRQLVLDLPELDGCFVDSHELGRCYGTAMALLTLSLLDNVEGQ